MSQHQNVSECACVCICLMSLARESGTVQVRTSNSSMRGEDEKNIKGGGLIWTALLCSCTLARLLSDKSRIHSAPPSLVCSTRNWLKQSRLSLLLQLVQLHEWIFVRFLKSDLILWGFSAVPVRPSAAPYEDALDKASPTLWEPVCVCVCVWEKASTHTPNTCLFLACDSCCPKINMY